MWAVGTCIHSGLFSDVVAEHYEQENPKNDCQKREPETFTLKGIIIPSLPYLIIDCSSALRLMAVLKPPNIKILAKVHRL